MLSTTPNFPRPMVAVGGVIIYNHKILLVQRGKAPNQGWWAIPGGRLEWGETMAQAVAREIAEETGLQVIVGEVVYTFDSIHRNAAGAIEFHYVIIDFLASPCDPQAIPIAGDDALAVRWCSLADLNTLPVVDITLQLARQLLSPPL